MDRHGWNVVITTPFGLTDGMLELGSMVTKSKISLISILFFLVVIVVANSDFGVGGLTKAPWLRS